MTEVLLDTDFTGIKHLKRGKVRDIYAMYDKLIFIATDRISAFDVVMPNGIPDKGRVLTRISEHWFRTTRHIIDNHFISSDVKDLPADLASFSDKLEGRFMLVEQVDPLPIECVVRGYLAGSGWKDYLDTGSVCGIRLPIGLKQADRLEEPIFTPATKASEGHDINITQEEAANLVGKELFERVKAISLALYELGHQSMREKGIILADTKFEFGLKDGELLLIDEVMTPDSSRFWPVETYQPGTSPPSFDKQFVRDYLQTLDWDKRPPAPELPPDIVQMTRDRYLKALEIIVG